jgi:bifunctional non-homologous end joining protein LigD
MKPEKVTLYFQQGTSDKVYHVSLEAVAAHRFVVHFAYGRRGATLTTGTKTKKQMPSWTRSRRLTEAASRLVLLMRCSSGRAAWRGSI